jgi:Recombination endonuclease VII
MSRPHCNKDIAVVYVTDSTKQCSLCKEIKLHTEFHKDKKNLHGKGLAYYCKKCANEKAREHAVRHSATVEYKEKKKRNYIKNRFNISLEEYQQKLVAQDSSCSICKIELPSSGYFTHLDHNHTTGRIRAFLCTNCNRGLGHFKENILFLENARKYLISHTDDGNQKEGSSL